MICVTANAGQIMSISARDYCWNWFHLENIIRTSIQMIIMVIIVVQVSSRMKLQCGLSLCRLSGREQAICIVHSLASQRCWFGRIGEIILSITRLIWYMRVVLESVGHRFNFNRQVRHIHCTFSLYISI